MSESRIDSLLDEMTVEEQISLLAGRDFWTTVATERLNVPSIEVSDGPNGARGGGAFVGGVKAAAFPAAIALAASWNLDLIEEIGADLAREAKSKGARVLLAPTVNIHRSTLNGRNFECYSEDPFLTSELAVAYIKGLQVNGVGAASSTSSATNPNISVSGRRRRAQLGSRLPRSAAQTGRAVFPHPAFMNGLSQSEGTVSVRRGRPA